jgi:hypothetical protein
MKIDPDNPVKILPHHLFPAFTIDEHLGFLKLPIIPSYII